MTDVLPPHLRPMVFAANELLLDMIYLLQSYTKRDLESILILLCVTDATMRPFMHELAPTAEILVCKRPPNEIRGAISRRMIADKTGLPRETVRRKTLELAQAGLIIIDENDRVRSAQRLDEPDFQQTVEGGNEAVVRYAQRLKSYGLDWEAIGLSKSRP